MVIEVVTFLLTPGTDERAFLDADARMQTGFVYLQPGLVRRTTARGDAGEWAVVTFWYSKQDANAAAERTDPVRDAFNAFVDASSMRRSLYETLD
jgi:hypothetical protein